MSKSKPSVISPEREEEIVQLWLGWIISGVFELRDGEGVIWGNAHTNKHVAEHKRVCDELDDRRHQIFGTAWDEVYKRYANIPLIEALS